MKFVIVLALSLVSSVAMADGLRCAGDNFKVKLYNHVQPQNGTKNPAILAVSERGIGTVVVLHGLEIDKTNRALSVVYSGEQNSTRDGRFTSVRFAVRKMAIQDGPYAGAYAAALRVNANGESREETLVCVRYLKHPKDSE